ncbi:hypothetical protein CLU96_1263 [Chryseobacterium sp. 52]|uniref:hypothetical protein n=1 Tax=Chryseobacterium sp. 52 TaxID=2035213 RepID=UPI000C199E14|nr:hypothetical protein [Chryseobacterium sp. 52]PIF44320.1 hypothetical protein CLU96_1263 [Chryseobacterium sp. 52]
MTKEQKIQEAYGEYWEEIKQYVNMNDGIAEVPSTVNRTEYLKKFKFIATWPDIGGFKQMLIPQSLEGLGDNNGWIKIESEEDLPKLTGLFWVMDSKYDAIGQAEWRSGRFVTRFNNLYQKDHISHYQPIEKPQPPIY